MAVEMIAEKYRFVKQDQDSNIGDLVTQLLYEIKLTVINMQIDDLDKQLQQAQKDGNIEQQFALLKVQPQLLEARNEICKILGNRVISI
jgi:predicted Zn-dependent protease